MTEKLLPCPFCGNEDIWIAKNEGLSFNSWDVWCHGDFMDPKDTHCGVYLENFKSEEIAKKLWNTRHDPVKEKLIEALDKVLIDCKEGLFEGMSAFNMAKEALELTRPRKENNEKDS